MTASTMNGKSTYLANAFSLQMLSSDGILKIEEVAIDEIKEAAMAGSLNSAIGHPDTAAVVSDMIGVTLPANRVNVALKEGDVLYVAQLMGGRLPEGATTLPEGFRLKFLKVEVYPPTTGLCTGPCPVGMIC